MIFDREWKNKNLHAHFLLLCTILLRFCYCTGNFAVSDFHDFYQSKEGSWEKTLKCKEDFFANGVIKNACVTTLTGSIFIKNQTINNIRFNLTHFLFEHTLFKNVSNGPAFLRQTQSQRIEYVLNDTIRIKKNDFFFIIYLSTSSDINFQTIFTSWVNVRC